MKKYVMLLVVIVLAVIGYRYYKMSLMEKEFVVIQEEMQVVNEPTTEDFSGLEEDLEQYL